MEGDATVWQIVKIICAMRAAACSPCSLISPCSPKQSAQNSQGCRRQMNGCPDTHDHFPADMPIGMAYVPWQKWAGYLRTRPRTGVRNYF